MCVRARARACVCVCVCVGGGGSTVFSFLAWSAAATPAHTSVEEILVAMPDIGNVMVARTGPDAQGGYTWTVTFVTVRQPAARAVAAQLQRLVA